MLSCCVLLQPSLTGHSRVVTHDVPVGVVPRRLWGDLAEPEMPDFDVSNYASLLSVKHDIFSQYRCSELTLL